MMGILHLKRQSLYWNGVKIDKYQAIICLKVSISLWARQVTYYSDVTWVMVSQIDCWFNSLFGLSTKQTLKCRITGSCHYNDVIMSAVASQITSLTIVYSTVCSRRRSKKTSKLRVTGLFVVNSPVTCEFTAQSASNAENVSIWWRHHDVALRCLIPLSEESIIDQCIPLTKGQ